MKKRSTNFLIKSPLLSDSKKSLALYCCSGFASDTDENTTDHHSDPNESLPSLSRENHKEDAIIKPIRGML